MKHIQFLLLISAILFFSIGCTNASKDTSQILQELNAERINASLPDINMKTLMGDYVNVKDISNNNVAFVAIWRSGCKYCQMDMPKLMKMQESFSDKDNVDFVHISWDTELQDIEDFKKKYGIPQEEDVLLDPKAEILKNSNLHTTGTPTLFVINPSGKIVAKVVGLREWDKKQLIKDMKNLAKNLLKSNS